MYTRYPDPKRYYLNIPRPNQRLLSIERMPKLYTQLAYAERLSNLELYLDYVLWFSGPINIYALDIKKRITECRAKMVKARLEEDRVKNSQ